MSEAYVPAEEPASYLEQDFSTSRDGCPGMHYRKLKQIIREEGQAAEAAVSRRKLTPLAEKTRAYLAKAGGPRDKQQIAKCIARTPKNIMLDHALLDLSDRRLIEVLDHGFFRITTAGLNYGSTS